MNPEETLITIVVLGGLVLLGSVLWFGFTYLLNQFIRWCARLIRSRFGRQRQTDHPTAFGERSPGATILRHPAWSAGPERPAGERERLYEVRRLRPEREPLRRRHG